MIRVFNSPNHKLNKKTQLEFNLSQHARDEELMRAIASYFNAGSVSLNRNAFVFRVVNFSELTENILPLFINYPIQGIKYFDYLDFLSDVEIIKNKNKTPSAKVIIYNRSYCKYYKTNLKCQEV